MFRGKTAGKLITAVPAVSTTRPVVWGTVANVGVPPATPLLQRDDSGFVPTNNRSAAPDDQWRWGFGPAGEPQRGALALAKTEEHLLQQDPGASPNPGGHGHAPQRASWPSGNCAHRHGCSVEQHAHDGEPATSGDRTAPPPPDHRRAAPGHRRLGQLPGGSTTSTGSRAQSKAARGMDNAAARPWQRAGRKA